MESNELNAFGKLVFKHKTNKRLFLVRAYRWNDCLVLLDETDYEVEEYRLYKRLEKIQMQRYTEVFVPVPVSMINTDKDINKVFHIFENQYL